MHVPTSPNATHSNGRTPSPTPDAGPAPGPDAKPPAAEGGRDTHGRFGKGNLGGPGNPFARQVAALRSALLASVTTEDMEAVTQQLVRQAKEGNVAAAKLLLSYTLGKPAAPVDPDTLDQQEWEIYRRAPDPGPDLAALPGRMPLSLACDMARAMLPALDRDWSRQFTDGFRAREIEEQLEAAAREERRRRRQERAERRRQGPSANGPDGAGRPSAPAQPPSANGGFGAERPNRGGGAADRPWSPPR
jgi:hypothetical protein